MGGAELTTKKSPADALAEFKKELTTALPPTITLKQAKEVKQNGVQSIYAVFHFKKLEDIQRVLANFGKGSLKEGDIGSDPQWSLKIETKENKSFYTQRFLLDVDAKAKAEIKAEVTVNGQKQEQKKSPEEDKASKEMEEQFKPLILSIVRMRFVLHTPAPITESNADIVLNGNTAVWNCSLAAFSKEKKPIEMKASF
jgi:transcriptional regulator with PAS, ATPase and Fis domain